MISYASIDRIEGEMAVCEVELLPLEESKAEDFATKNTVMMDVFLDEFLEEVKEGDIFVVEHNGENVNLIYKKDEEEKSRRREVFKSITG